MVQELIVFFIVVAAVVYLVRSWLLANSGKKGCNSCALHRTANGTQHPAARDAATRDAAPREDAPNGNRELIRIKLNGEANGAPSSPNGHHPIAPRREDSS